MVRLVTGVRAARGAGWRRGGFSPRRMTLRRGIVRDLGTSYATKAWEALDGPERLDVLLEKLQAPGVLDEVSRSASSVLGELTQSVSSAASSVEGVLYGIDLDLDGVVPPPEVALAAAVAIASIKVIESLSSSSSSSSSSSVATGPGEELPMSYDPDRAAKYFSKRKGLVLRRILEILRGSLAFLLSLKTEGNLDGGQVTEETREKQAVQLRLLLAELGPTFVKAGQALSIRVDLLPEAYLKELRKLQDAVPPFPTEEALEILNGELRPQGGVSGVFETISPEPVASASLGQVYRATLRSSGKEVAVKVQRPGILPSISLDMHILRLLAPYIQQSKNLNSDLVGLLDQWGERFVAELDYQREAENGKEFMEAMKARKITSVTAANPVDELCTNKVLITEWIYGERLELSEEEDVAKLCGLALTAYLTMLLDTGVLHADPHPGNLLRTDEGKLCILDWGLTTEITTDQQYAIIDYIAHLVAEDYVRIPKDLVSLGFIPKGKELAVDDQGVVRALSKVFRNLARGGGVKGINVADVGLEVQFIQEKYGNIFQIPPYFAYILRAFSVLEGIGLQNNPKYAIVQECYPYIARRLFSDNTPRVRSALRAIMYEPSSVEGQMRLNVRRFQKLANAFRTYNEQSVSLMPKDYTPTEEEDNERQAVILREGLELLFSVEGNYLQEILVREAARTVDTVGRHVLERFLGQGIDAVTGGRNPAEVVFPFNTLDPAMREQVEFLFSPLAAKSEDDEVVLETAQAVWEIIQPEVSSLLESSPPTDLSTFAKKGSEASKVLPSIDEVGPGVFATAIRFNAALFERVTSRIGLSNGGK
ncbi:ABC1 domain-containing protein [Chloropicon primus]|uniref:ABC1 domain-containing protein n=1 Tax=Chloropicon primus TaxID=1764295 RepID=A0A5B8MRM1_9CHLO|nr:ABC1 domain-containing protein [Chloropicon primus]|eukprot:QDZ23378.1 ABC1 domain-containing protein [Chloropicon primus]